MVTRKVCETCFYWERVGITYEGMCKRFPPVHTSSYKPPFISVRTFEDDWCGEHPEIKEAEKW